MYRTAGIVKIDPPAIKIEPAIPTLALDALPWAPDVSRPCSEWERVFPSGYGHRHYGGGRSSFDEDRRSGAALSGRRVSLTIWGASWSLHLALFRGLAHVRDTSEEENNAAKRSTVSTGWLSVLPHLHVRPIDLVVYEESSLTRDT